MSFSFSLRTKLLGTSSLAAGAFMFGAGILGASPAYAACSGGPVADNAVITCSGPGNTPVTGTADDVSITMSSGDISGAGVPAIQLIGDRNTITLNLDALATSAGADYYGTIDMYGDDATLIIEGDADVHATSNGESTPAVLLDGDNVTFSFTSVSGAQVNLQTTGSAAESYAALVVHSRNHTITLNNNTHVSVYGAGGLGDDYIGMDIINYAEDATERGTITFGRYSSAFVLMQGAVNGADIYGIREIGNGPGPLKYASDITFNTGSYARVEANGAVGSRVVGVMQRGDYGTITLNDTTDTIVTSYGGSNNDLAGLGQYGDFTSITLNDRGHVTLRGNGGAGSYFTGIGAGGYASSITLNNRAIVEVHATLARSAIGIVMNADYGNLTMNDTANVRMYGETNLLGAGVAVYGSENTVTLNDYAMIDTLYAEVGARGMAGLLVGGNLDSTIALNDYSAIYAGDAPAIVMAGGFGNSVFLGEGAILSGYNGLYVSDSFDTITLNGTVIGAGGVAVDMLQGSDNLLNIGSAIITGDIIGSGISDRLNIFGTGTFADDVSGFDEVFISNPSQRWTLASGATMNAGEVTVSAGIFVVDGAVTATDIEVAAGAALAGTGTLTGNMVVNGTLAPGLSPGVLNVVGTLGFAAGSVFDVEIEGGLADQVNVSGAPGTVTIAPGAILQSTFTGGTDGFAGDILTATGGITGTFAFAGAGVLDYSNPNVLTLVSTSSSSLNGAMSAGASQGFLFLDTVLGQASRSAGAGRMLWATALSDRSDRAGDGASRGFEQRNAGGAFGGDVWRSGDMKLGLAGGYIDGKVTTSGGGSRSTIDGYHVAAYGSLRSGATWATGALTAAYQDQSASRNVLAGGIVSTARGAPEAWSGGAGLGIGHDLPLNGAFTLTPQAGVTYQHVERDGFSETGGGAGAFALDGISSDTLHARAGAELSLNITDPNAMWKVRPAINAALVQEWRGGDATANGTFVTSGARFTAALDQRDQTYLALGAGVDVGVGYGVTAFVSYDGGFGGDAERSGGWRLGARMEW